MGSSGANEYSKGIELRKEEKFTEAFAMFLKGADLNNGEACNAVGDCYYNGEGVKQNFFTAFEWYMKAAILGNAKGQCNVGYCYGNGKGTEQDYCKSFEWYKKAADQNDGDALYNLGNRYYQGQGVAKNAVEALRFFMQATQNGNALGYFMAGIILYIGDDVPQDLPKAAEMFQKCAEKTQHRQAYYYLGEMYLVGKGVKKDRSLARNNLTMSALQGYPDAIDLIDQNADLFSEQLTNAFYNRLMAMNVQCSDMTQSPDFQLFSLSNMCMKRGYDIYTTRGIIAQQLCDIGSAYRPEQAVQVNYVGLSKKWILGVK